MDTSIYIPYAIGGGDDGQHAEVVARTHLVDPFYGLPRLEHNAAKGSASLPLAAIILLPELDPCIPSTHNLLPPPHRVSLFVKGEEMAHGSHLTDLLSENCDGH